MLVTPSYIAQASLANLGIQTGTATPMGTVTTVYKIPHGMKTKPVWCGVSANNALATALFTIDWDATNITVTYLVALTGTLSLKWFALG